MYLQVSHMMVQNLYSELRLRLQKNKLRNPKYGLETIRFAYPNLAFGSNNYSSFVYVRSFVYVLLFNSFAILAIDIFPGKGYGSRLC